MIRKIKPLLLLVLPVVFLAMPAGSVVAQSGTQGPAPPPSSTRAVGFRTTDWTTKHLHDAAVASKLVESLKKIGCEVTQHDHNGHIDVRYRSGGWRTLTVENDELAKQWSRWLVHHGMETVIVDPPATTTANKVKFRLADWRSVHLHDASQAEQMGKILKMLGCESERSAHDGHIDIRFRCVNWKSIALHTHDASHQWQNWLNQNGFETAHQH